MTCSSIINKINNLPTHIEARKLFDDSFPGDYFRYLVCLYYGNKLGHIFMESDLNKYKKETLHLDLSITGEDINEEILNDSYFKDRLDNSEFVQVFYNV